MKGTQSGPAPRASISSKQPTRPHQCTINENLFHSASHSVPTHTHTLSLSLATFATHVFKSHLDAVLQLLFLTRCLWKASQWLRVLLHLLLLLLGIPQESQSQCMCVAQIFLSGTGERWESKCVMLTERRGSQSVWTTRTHRLPDSISPSRDRELHIKSVHLTCSGRQKWHVSFQSARLSLDACPRCMEEITNGAHHLQLRTHAYSYWFINGNA